MLLLQQRHIGEEKVGDVLRRADYGPLLRVGGEQTAAQLQGCQHLGRLRLANGVLSAELADGGAGKSRQAVEAGEEPGGLGDDVLAGGAGAEDDGEQLSVGESGGAHACPP